MRDQRTIEREIHSARGDLESTLGELKDVVQDKLDFKKRAHEMIARGKHEALELLQKLKVGVRERPAVAVLASIGLLGLGVAAFVARRRRRDMRFEVLEHLRDQLCR